MKLPVSKLPVSFALVSTLALAACSSEAPTPAPSGSETTPPVASTTPEPAPAASAAPGQPPVAAVFPAAMRGRWGLVPADCTTTNGDEKGLIIIDAGSMRFYESVAKIGAIKEASDTKLRATLAFEGEGMQWQHDATLEAAPGSSKLVMEQFGGDVKGPQTYTKCK